MPQGTFPPLLKPVPAAAFQGRAVPAAHPAAPYHLPLPMHPLAPAIRTVWTIKFAAWSALALLLVFVYDLTHFLGDDASWLPPGVLTVAVLLGGVLVSLLIPRLRYRYWRYDLKPEELYLERGILNRVRTIVPLRRIQHLDVSQNLLEREFELGKLIVHTAGSRSSDVVVPGLRFEEAEQLRDTVKHYILEDAV